MKLKSIFPYLLFGSLLFIPNGANKSNAPKTGFATHQIIDTNIPNTRDLINAKAQELVDTYIDNVLQGQKNIKHGKGGHRTAVLREFPGAYVRWYCIYGQYTQLNRALGSLGDTLTVIPFGGRHSCPEFRRLMKQKYSGPEYAGALHNGKMYKSDKDYNTALNAYLRHNNVNADTPSDVRQKLIDRFAQNNFSIESLHPGTILIIQKSATPSNTHAVMYLGRGRMENGVFVPDSNGKFLYAGYNNESIDDVFTTYRTNRMFAADIYDIAAVEYSKELNKIQNMKYEEMFRYVYDMPCDLYAMTPNIQSLREMATDKYFNNQDFSPYMQPVKQNMASMFPMIQIMENRVRQQKFGLIK